MLIDDEQLLDPELMQKALGLALLHALAHGDQAILGHQLGDGLARVRGEAHVAVGEDADELALLASGAALDHGHSRNAVLLHQRKGVGKRLVGKDGDRVRHHPRFELLHLAHLIGLRLGREIAVDDAEPADLRHGDCHARLGHRVHRGGEEGNVQPQLTRQASAHIDLRRQDIGRRRLQQHVIEGEPFAKRAHEGTRVDCQRARGERNPWRANPWRASFWAGRSWPTPAAFAA